MAQPSTEHTDWAFYNDGTESGSVIIGSKNTNPTLNVDTIYLYRAGVHETAGNVEDAPPFQIQYNLNAAGWNNVDGVSSVVQIVATSNIADGDDTTQRMTSFTHVSNNDGFDEVDGICGELADLQSNGFECLWAFQIIGTDVSDADSIELKVVFGSGGRADLDAYNQTNPTITVSEAVASTSPSASPSASPSTSPSKPVNIFVSSSLLTQTILTLTFPLSRSRNCSILLLN